MQAPLFLGVVVGPLSVSGTINMLPTLKEDFGVSLSLAGLAVSLFVLSLVVVQLWSGVITGFLGPKRTLFIGLSVFAISCLAAALVSSYPAFLAARTVQGLGAGIALPVSMGLAAENAPPGRMTTAIGGIQAAFTIGLALGPAAGGLFAEHLDWRGFYVFLAGMAAVAALILAIAYSGGSDRRSGVNPLSALKQALNVPAVRLVSLAGFLNLLAMISVLIFVAVWLQRTGLTGPSTSGLLLSIPGFVGFIFAPLAGLLGDRIGNRRAVIGGTVVFAAGVLGLVAFPRALVVYPLFLIMVGVGNAFMMTNMGAMALSLRPDLRQAISGVFNASRFFGVLLAPLVLTPVYEAFSIRGVLVVIIAASIIVGLVLPISERETDARS